MPNVRNTRGPRQLVLSCEHATNHVPAKYRDLFTLSPGVLNTHRGWDPGTLELGKLLCRELGVPCQFGQVSRLLIELNRSAKHPRLFSEFALQLPESARELLVQKYWQPYRDAVAEDIRRVVRRGAAVLHVSLHSFTPVLDGESRQADIGLLYDPRRPAERLASTAWISDLNSRLPGFRIRRNYPYRGTSDGLTTALRKQFPDKSYSGIELEVSQKYPHGSRTGWRDLQKRLVDSIRNLTSPGL